MMGHYSTTAKCFHWLTVAGIVMLFTLGWIMVDLQLSPDKLKYYAWHKWLGCTVFALTVARLLWRTTHPVPPLPDDLPPATRYMANAMHICLYVTLLAMPIIGWLRSSAEGISVVLFGVVSLPDVIEKDKTLAETLEFAHWAGSWFLLTLILGHSLAALGHHFLRRDKVLTSMLPRCRWCSLTITAIILLLATTFTTIAKAGSADPWLIDSNNSEISFEGKQLGVVMVGHFSVWQAEIIFDPNNINATRVRIEIDTSSINTGFPEADELMARNSWLAITRFPKAIFEATQLRQTGSNLYEAHGQLKIRDQIRPVKIPLTLHIAPLPSVPNTLHGKATGELVIGRLDFDLGRGAWADTDTIANEVRILFTLQGKRSL